MEAPRPSSATSSVTTSMVALELKPEGYAVATISREPVNSMNLDLWRELAGTLDHLEQHPGVRGVIWQSGLKKDVFTAGNDLLELYAPKTSYERYREFWVTQNTFLARLYRSPLVTIAAIRGACPAGGCVTSLACDVRVMSDFGTFGLNEVALGISVPEYWGKLMVQTIGQRPAERLLLSGTLPTAAEALDLGLIDAMVPVGQLTSRAEEMMKALLTAPDQARRITKAQLRTPFAKAWEAFCPGEADTAWQMLKSPQVTEMLAGVLQRLSRPK